MKGKWSDYLFSKNEKVMERYQDLIVYWYYDIDLEEERYAVVLEDAILLNTREYPEEDLYSIADIYGEFLAQKRSRKEAPRRKQPWSPETEDGLAGHLFDQALLLDWSTIR